MRPKTFPRLKFFPILFRSSLIAPVHPFCGRFKNHFLVVFSQIVLDLKYLAVRFLFLFEDGTWSNQHQT